MNKYVVAFMSYFDSRMTQTLVQAETEIDAAISVLQKNGWDGAYLKLPENMEELKTFAFNGDCMFSVFPL